MKIHVTFVDAATNQIMGETDLDPEQLPDSFDTSALATTMHMGGADWHVEKAEPADRAGFAATGRLHLTVQKLEMVRSDELLYSLPTLVDALPRLQQGDVGRAFVLHEDDWRQREFVSTAFRPEIAAEFDLIRAARASSVGAGYQRLHVRERIPEPLAGVALPISAVAAALGPIPRSDVAIGDGLVVGGFAFVVGGGAVYGQEDRGRVVTLALAGSADAGPFGGLSAAYALDLVDWVRAETA